MELTPAHRYIHGASRNTRSLQHSDTVITPQSLHLLEQQSCDALQGKLGSLRLPCWP